MPCLSVCNDCGKGGLASGSGSSRNSYEKRQSFVYFQDAFHFGERFFGFCNTRAHSFRAVHTGTAAETDNDVAPVFMIELQRFCYVDRSWVGNGFVVYCIWKAVLRQSFFQSLCKPEVCNSGIGNDQ